MSLVIENITKYYGAQKALDSVSFSVESSEIIGFLGPNGAGKSTMMKIITGYLQPDQGRIEVCGLDVQEHLKQTQALIGYLPEHNPLYLEMYVREFLAFNARIHKLDKVSTRVAEMIDLVGLSKESHKKIGALSKGYRQRVGLASALIHDPKVLILDEPTTGLDPNQILEIRELIKTLGADKTIMMSTHILQEVEAICDRVLILDQGKLKLNQHKSQINKELSQQVYFFEVLFSDQVIEDKMLEIIGVQDVNKLGEHKYLIKAEQDVRKQIFDFAVKQNNAILNLTEKKQALESIFKSTTGA